MSNGIVAVLSDPELEQQQAAGEDACESRRRLAAAMGLEAGGARALSKEEIRKASKALAAQDVLDAAVHAGALRQLHARAARVFGSRQKADAAAADWREKNRAFQRENCTDVDPKKKLLDGDAARPTTIFDDDQGTCAAAAMPPAPSPANRAREGS